MSGIFEGIKRDLGELGFVECIFVVMLVWVYLLEWKVFGDVLWFGGGGVFVLVYK